MGNNPSGYSELSIFPCCEEIYITLNKAHNELSTHEWVYFSENFRRSWKDPSKIVEIQELRKYKLRRLLTFAECHETLGHEICMKHWELYRDYRTLLFLNLLTIIPLAKSSNLNYTCNSKYKSVKVDWSYAENLTHNFSLRMVEHLDKTHSYE